MRSVKGLAAALVGFLLLSARAGAAPLFMGLGDLPGGSINSVALDLSGDGTAVVGTSSSSNGPREAFRWTASTGIEGLGDLPGGDFDSSALAVSGDGSVVVGQTDVRPVILDSFSAFRWTPDAGMVGLGELPGGGQGSRATGVSADGRIVVGDASSGNATLPLSEAFRWTEEQGMIGLGDLPGGAFHSIAWDISLDGSVIVGESSSQDGFEAFRWTETEPGLGIMEALGDLPGGGFDSRAVGASADGSVLVGSSDAEAGEQAFRWTPEQGMVGLGDLAGGGFRSFAFDVSADGSVVVGSSETNLGLEAFIWDRIHGMRNLRGVLTQEFSLDLEGWTLVTAVGMSSDGRVIAGTATNPNGQFEPWMAIIPEPSTVALIAVGLVSLTIGSRRPRLCPPSERTGACRSFFACSNTLNRVTREVRASPHPAPTRGGGPIRANPKRWFHRAPRGRPGPRGRPAFVRRECGGPPQTLLDQLRSGQAVEAMVEFETTAVDQEADALAAAAGRIFHGAPELAFKRAEYALIKEAAVDAIAGVEVLQEYRNLPVGFLRIASESALFALLALPEVSAVREVEQYELFTAETLPFIEQPPVDAAGIRGQGMTVAVLDTGVLWQQAVFQCPMPPGTPGCRIVDAIFEAAPDDGNDQDDHPSFHGTNVSGIVAETAPDTTLLVADVADPGSFQFPFAIRDPSVYSAVDWVLDRVGTFNIASMNLSFGKAIPYHTQPCASAALGPALDSVLAAGIQPVAAAGNGAFQNGSFVDGIIEPACSPAAVSVGAVYDLNYGSVTWPFGVNQCTDPATQEDLVTCFSQTAPFLSLLAPGVAVEAAGIVLTGTSMAAPHVAGAWAIYRAAMPGASHAEILQALQDRGQPDSDPRVANRVVSRINLFDGLDADQGVGDGVLFPQDNCTELINASQVDSDTDGFGNHCDGDFDQDGGAGIPDFAIFRACVGEAVPSASMAGGDHDPTCAESDMTGDGGVGILDFAYFRAALGDPPGPSGLPCADPVEPMPGCTTPASLAGNAAQLTGDGAGEAAGLYEEEDAQGRFVFAADSSGAELTVHTDASGEATHVTDETGATVLDLAP